MLSTIAAVGGAFAYYSAYKDAGVKVKHDMLNTAARQDDPFENTGFQVRDARTKSFMGDQYAGHVLPPIDMWRGHWGQKMVPPDQVGTHKLPAAHMVRRVATNRWSAKLNLNGVDIPPPDDGGLDPFLQLRNYRWPLRTGVEMDDNLGILTNNVVRRHPTALRRLGGSWFNRSTG